MPDVLAIEQFERRLIELGCPARRLREKVRELGDHYLDLEEAALAEGLSASEAATQATARLGDPVVLAENLILGMRRASWWGRHPFIGFCLLPMLVFIFVWLGCLGGLVGMCRLEGWIFGPAYSFDEAAMAAFQGNATVFNEFVKPLKTGLDVVSCVLLTLGFCWLARRSAMGWKWMVATCAACFAASQIFWSSIEPHNLTVGLRWGLRGWPGSMPLIIGVAVFLYQRGWEKRFAPIPARMNQARPFDAAHPTLLRRLALTPTYWVVVLLAGLILWGVLERRAGVRQEAMHRAELKNKIWPAERAATLALLKTGQTTLASGNETTIDLKPWLNEALATSTDDPAPVKGNNLAGLPAGVHIFGGVPFEVTGRVQLAGQVKPGQTGKFPARIRGITIGRKCDRLYLLHAGSNVNASTLGKEVARLVLHYQDGSQAEIGIISGEHVLDWWGPIYNTDSGVGRYTTSPGTELAWAGSNPRIRARAPDFSLRLYRSTFANPHPGLEIASIDYDSTLTEAAPFLVGLTVEQIGH
jgi:hypothetical protein